MSWALAKKLDAFAGPGEIKRREVSWTLTKKLDCLLGSRRDQEEGGELDPQSRQPRTERQEQGGGAGLQRKVVFLLLQLFPTAVLRTLSSVKSVVTLLRTADS